MLLGGVWRLELCLEYEGCSGTFEYAANCLPWVAVASLFFSILLLHTLCKWGGNFV